MLNEFRIFAILTFSIMLFANMVFIIFVYNILISLLHWKFIWKLSIFSGQIRCQICNERKCPLKNKETNHHSLQICCGNQVECYKSLSTKNLLRIKRQNSIWSKFVDATLSKNDQLKTFVLLAILNDLIIAFLHFNWNWILL